MFSSVHVRCEQTLCMRFEVCALGSFLTGTAVLGGAGALLDSGAARVGASGASAGGETTQVGSSAGRLPAATDGTAGSPYSSGGMKYGNAAATDTAGNPLPSVPKLVNDPNINIPPGGSGELAVKPYSGNPVAPDFIGPLDKNAQASLNFGKITAPIDFDGHVLSAEIKLNGNVVGGHSTATGEVRVIPGTSSAPNAQGVYSARIEVADPSNPGQFLPKTNGNPPGTSTMFPENWTAERVKVEVDFAYSNRIPIPGKPGMWQGVTPSGVKVEGWLSPNVTAYPKM